MSEHTTSWIGGVTLGWVSASAPLATLIASPSCLTLKTGGLGTYRFYKEYVSSIECRNAWFDKSIKIVHSNLDAPVGITFFCLEEPQKIVETIRQLGFAPEGHSASVRDRQGIPVRWTAILIAIGIGSLPSLVAQWYPHLMHLQILALAVLFLSAHLLLVNASLQKLVLRQGRRVGEIRPFLKLCVFTFWMLVLASGIALTVSKYPVLILPFLVLGKVVLLPFIGYPAWRFLRYRKQKG